MCDGDIDGINGERKIGNEKKQGESLVAFAIIGAWSGSGCCNDSWSGISEHFPDRYQKVWTTSINRYI